METYQQAIDFLDRRINYERARTGSYSARDFKLDRMRQLLSLLANPQERLPAVHIAGTKGKGSTAVMIAEMLTAAGYRVGLFTSPHISAFEERMKVDGVSPSAGQLVELVNRIAGPVATMDRCSGPMSPTYFEIATAMAWLYFGDQQAQLVVLEVGLGGRLDSTNICNPEVCVITNVSRDHTALLGTKLWQIAGEKAGIVKPGVPVLSGVTNGEARQVVETTCGERHSPLIQLQREIRYRYRCRRRPPPETLLNGWAREASVDVETPRQSWSNVPVPLAGEHQGANAALAVGSIDVLAEGGWHVSAAAVHSGMTAVRWPLRIEVLRTRPMVVVDAAHNWVSIEALLKTLNSTLYGRRRIVVFGSSKDKDVTGLLRQIIPEFDTVILTQYLRNPRAVPVAELHRQAQAISESPVHSAADPKAAWNLAARLSAPEDLICVTGSFFLAVEARELVLEQPAAAEHHDGTHFDTATLP